MQKEENQSYVNISQTLQVNWSKELGKGSFGEVYAGRINHRGKQIDCAIKIIGQKGRRLQENTYFKQEAEFSKKMIELFQKIRNQHGNDVKIPLVEIYEIVWSVNQDKCCIAMEMCGNSLASERYFLFQKRDIKPDNIFVVNKITFEIRIGDYGLASYNLNSKSTVGTIGYMAPEIAQKALDKQEKQAQNAQKIQKLNEMGNQNNLQIEEPKTEENEKYTNKVDIWSLGIILHELITGNQLFIGYHPKKTMTEIVKFGSYYVKWKTSMQFEPPPKNSHLSSDFRNTLEYYLPWKLVGYDRVAQLIDQMLKKDPNERLSAAQVYQECESIQNDPQLLIEQIRLLNEQLSQDEINVNEMIIQKVQFEARLQEFQQRSSQQGEQGCSPSFQQRTEMSHGGEMEIEKAKQENNNENKSTSIIQESSIDHQQYNGSKSTAPTAASSSISSGQQSQIPHNNKASFLSEKSHIQPEEFQKLNIIINQIYNYCKDGRKLVLKQLQDSTNRSSDDITRDGELRQIHQNLFSCIQLFSYVNQPGPQNLAQKTSIDYAYLIIQPLESDFFKSQTYFTYFNNFHKLLFNQQLPQYQNTPLLLNVVKLQYIFFLDEGFLSPSQNLLDKQQEEQFLKERIPYFIYLEIPGVSLYDYIRTEKIKQEQNGSWSKEIILNKIDILIQITSGLCEMHKLGIFHCNMHAKNIFLSKDNQFQINFISREELEIRNFLQNFRYSATSKSPSQILEQENSLDIKNDLWSLGIIFHYVFTIQNLFSPGITVKQTILTSKFNYLQIWDRCQKYLEQRSSGKKIEEPKLEQLSQTFIKIPNRQMAELTSNLFEAKEKQITIEEILEKLKNIGEQINNPEVQQNIYPNKIVDIPLQNELQKDQQINNSSNKMLL